MAVLVLGGYGLIGQAIVQRLRAAALDVIGLGRDVAQAQRRFPDVTWRSADISRLTQPSDWVDVLDGVDAVINASGALQEGPRDNLVALHATSIAALVVAMEQAGIRPLVQISAVGATPSATTTFLRTKASGDDAVRASDLDWWILRPGLVISQTPHGGTALLRALAAFPIVTPLVSAESKVQAIGVADVAETVLAALDGKIPARSNLDLVEPTGRSLAETAAAFRGWLGLPCAKPLRMPKVLGTAISWVADGLGLLGWRSPLRSTALRVMTLGVEGDPAPARQVLGQDFQDLPCILAHMPATVADLWFARLWGLKPLILGGLATFWITSGLIGWISLSDAQDVLSGRGMAPGLAMALVLTGIAADLILGCAILVRPLARFGLLGTIAVSLGYVAASLVFAPDLWLDP